MIKTGIKLFVILVLLLTVAVTFNSCKSCNKGKTDVVKTDTVKIPALEDVTNHIKKDSLNPNLWFQRAQIYAESKDYKSANTDMYIALSLDSTQPEFYLFSAELFKRSGDTQRGIALMNKAIGLDSSNTKFYIKAAELAYIDTNLSKHYQVALNYLNRAIEHDMQNPDIYFFKGTVYKEMGDTTRALSSFQTATELNPRYYDAYVQLGLLLHNKHDKKAEQYLDNAIKVSDKPADALYAKANIYKEEGLALFDGKHDAEAREKLSIAIDNFKQAAEINHTNVEIYMGIAKCYYEMDSVEDAYRFYDLATKMSPAYAGAYFSKGICAEDMGKTAEAMALYQNCLDLDPKFERASEHLKRLQKTP